MKFTEEPEFSLVIRRKVYEWVERFKGGGRKVLLMMSVLSGHSDIMCSGYNQRICDNRRIIADEIASEMNVFETRATRMVKGPIEGILF